MRGSFGLPGLLDKPFTLDAGRRPASFFAELFGFI